MVYLQDKPPRAFVGQNQRGIEEMKCKMLPLALGLALLAGCAPTAEEQMAKVTPA